MNPDLQASLENLHKAADDFDTVLSRLEGRAEKAPEPSGPPPMPEPVEAWLVKGVKKDFVLATPPESHCNPYFYGPHFIIPGMMSLDELLVHKLNVAYNFDRKMWCVRKVHLTLLVDGRIAWYPTSLEAQWGATCLAKGGKG